MAGPCSTHADREAVGTCRTCARPVCESCSVEDIGTDFLFCSDACLVVDRSATGAKPRSAEELIQDLRRPIVRGWALWLRNIGPITTKVGLPLALAYTAVSFLAPANVDTESLALADLANLLLGALGAAAVAIFLSHAHVGSVLANPWPVTFRRVVPWAITYAITLVAALIGFFLLVIPGFVVGVRLFWADEFALIHRHGPVGALKRSLALTRGLGMRVFGFQFAVGFAQYLWIVPLLIGFVAVELATEAIASDVARTLIEGLSHPLLLVNFYASAHAPEVVYFYGIRALRSRLPDAGAEVTGDWVARGLSQQQR